jgi:V8-like Glu-specific endopeptidase
MSNLLHKRRIIMVQRNTHHQYASLLTLFAVGLPLLLGACVDENSEDVADAQVEDQEIVYELVPADYPYMEGEDTICSVWAADLGDTIDHRVEFYIMGRMNQELAEEPAWREYYGRDEVKTCDEAREYQRLRFEYDLEHLPPTDPSIGGEYPEEPAEKIGEPPGGINNNANLDPVVQMTRNPGVGNGCSGTLIHPRVVLTAAHCFAPADSTMFLRREENGGVIDYVEYDAITYRDANYTGAGDPGDDIGLVIFDNPIPGVDVGADTMRVMTSSINVPDAIVFYGWGVLNHSGTLGGVMRWGQANINWASYPYFVDNVFEGGSRICKGDSGGPATLDKVANDLTYDLVGGMASEYTGGNSFCPDPGDYQRWSATNDKIEWIETRLAIAGIDLTPSDASTQCPRFSESGRNYMRCWN